LFDWVTLLQAILGGALHGGVLALIAIGLTLVFGVMEIINFAHCEFLMVGMYISYWLYTLTGIDPYLSVVISVPTLFLVGVLIQRFVINPVLGASANIQVILTIGISLFLQNLMLFLFSADPKPVNLSYSTDLFIIRDVLFFPRVRVFTFLGSMGLTIILYLLLMRTHLGRTIRAAAENRRAALLMGINVERIFIFSFGIGLACAGAAGSMILPFYPASPEAGMHFIMTAFVIVILGTLGNFVGAFIAGIIIGVVEAVGATYLPGGSLYEALTFVVFVGFMLFRPNGLFGRSAGR
jgi:branched-chain amino acid transport system permease protein